MFSALFHVVGWEESLGSRFSSYQLGASTGVSLSWWRLTPNLHRGLKTLLE